MSLAPPADPLGTLGLSPRGFESAWPIRAGTGAELLALHRGGQALPLAGPNGDSDPKAVRDAATMLEGHFITILLRQMRESMVLDEDEEGEEGWFEPSRAERMFTDQLDEALGEELAQRGQLGIADLIVRQLLPPETAP